VSTPSNAVQNGANVINMSFDFTTSSAELATALEYASRSALVCASSAGNSGQRAIVYPAALQSVTMGVASTDNNDARSSFSNYGNAIVWVAAPGEEIVTTYPFGNYAAGWGTSFSAPFVAGTFPLGNAAAAYQSLADGQAGRSCYGRKDQPHVLGSTSVVGGLAVGTIYSP